MISAFPTPKFPRVKKRGRLAALDPNLFSLHCNCVTPSVRWCINELRTAQRCWCKLNESLPDRMRTKYSRVSVMSCGFKSQRQLPCQLIAKRWALTTVLSELLYSLTVCSEGSLDQELLCCRLGQVMADRMCLVVPQ